MKEITSKELVLRFTAEVQESNLDEFEQTSKEVLESINTDLKTGEDFIEAKENIKSCKLTEDRIHNARQQALSKAGDVFEKITKTEQIQELFRQKRLFLEKPVAKEETAAKKRIVDDGICILDNILSGSKISGLYIYDASLFLAAAKNKRSTEKLQEAIDEVVHDETNKILAAQDNYTTNIDKILGSQEEYPGLFPDKKQLAMKDSSVASSEIESRVAKFKLAEIEKKQREDAAKKKKDEEEAEARKKADAERVKEVVIPEPTKTYAPLMDTPPPETLFEPLEDIPLPPAPPTEKYVCTLFVQAEKDCNIQLLKNIMEEFSGVLGVEIGGCN